jgi:hypothetical protein
MNAPGGTRPRVGCRLIVDAQLPGDDRPAQLVFQCQPLQGRIVHPRIEDLGAGAARFLRAIERHVGEAQQILRAIGWPGAERDADARGRDILVAVDRDRRVHRRVEPLGHAERRREAIHTQQQGGELVPAEPGEHVAVAQSDA